MSGSTGAIAGDTLPFELCCPSRFLSIEERFGAISLGNVPGFDDWRIRELERAIWSVFKVEYVHFNASAMRMSFKLVSNESHRVVRYIITSIMRTIYLAKEGAVLLFDRIELEAAHARAVAGNVHRKAQSGAKRYISWGKPETVVVDSNNYAV
jgi:hypothetical protein